MDTVDRNKDAENPVLCFFFPYHEVSGVPMLFSRMANKIAEMHPGMRIAVIDYKDGAIARSLQPGNGIEVWEFNDGKKITVPSNCVLAMQSILPYAMRPELVIKPNTKILFWTLHPDNLIPVLLPLPGLRNIQNNHFWFYKLLGQIFFRKKIQSCRTFVQICNSKNGLVFMDQSNLEKTEKYLFVKELKTDFLPVPSIPSPYTKKRPDLDTVHFCWIGRLCDFKSHILIYTIKKISEIAKKKSVTVFYHIIGDGPFLEQISTLQVEHTGFRLCMEGTMTPEELDKFLLLRADVVTAMGTSALEGAKLGIPTVLLDISYASIEKDYSFRWLHHTRNFDLGHDIQEEDYQAGNTSLENMFQSVLTQYDELSALALNYFLNNHDIKTVTENFLAAAGGSRLSYSDIPANMIKKGLFRKWYDKKRGYS